MRLTIGLILFMLPTVAMGQCNTGTAEIFKLTKWSAEAEGEHSTIVSTLYTNASPKGVEMVDGTIWFDDALGDSIGGVRLDRDPQSDPGGSITQISRMAGFRRLTKTKPENISAYICVKAVLYDDGTKETFD